MSTINHTSIRALSGVDRLWGSGALASLQSSSAVVIGLGGVGSWCAEALARSGLGQIMLVDMDHVSESNINRQLQATQSNIGRSKVLAMQERIESIHGHTKVYAIDEMCDALSGQRILDECMSRSKDKPLVVLDCCDDVHAKTWLIEQQIKTNQLAQPTWKLIVSGAAGGKTQPHRIQCQPMGRVTHDPLIASVRRRLKNQGFESVISLNHMFDSVDCVFSTEPAKRSTDMSACTTGAKINCAGYGSSVMVTAAFGFIAAARAVEWVLSQHQS